MGKVLENKLNRNYNVQFKGKFKIHFLIQIEYQHMFSWYRSSTRSDQRVQCTQLTCGKICFVKGNPGSQPAPERVPNAATPSCTDENPAQTLPAQQPSSQEKTQLSPRRFQVDAQLASERVPTQSMRYTLSRLSYNVHYLAF